ncbi:hypothetical protein HDV02_003007 [Globomyces sp. JEL0801]|nr:hypothetical protein HDV02_003006 [Globomyces sp. JEL0801]KAJ2992516.1 hypothetical protein HDV02_003007 [Globomyces sp. JEL0801]
MEPQENPLLTPKRINVRYSQMPSTPPPSISLKKPFLLLPGSESPTESHNSLPSHSGNLVTQNEINDGSNHENRLTSDASSSTINQFTFPNRGESLDRSNALSQAGQSSLVLNSTERQPQKHGSSISVLRVIESPFWIASVGSTKWVTESPWKQKLISDTGDTIFFILFGTINTAQCGKYGDYVPLFKDSFTKANMKWVLRSPEGHHEDFRKQLFAIEKLSDSISDYFKDNGISKHRPVKTMAELELRCKLVKPRVEGAVTIKPTDSEGQKHWATCFDKGFEPNTMPKGVYSYEGEKVGFEDYEKTLRPGTNVVATCKLQAAMFNKEAFVQLVPLKFQVFGSEKPVEEEIPDIF